MVLSNAPKLLKGALLAFDLPVLIPRVTVFQYNPATLTRTLEPQMQETESKTGDPPRFKGAPVETIKLDVEFDATDQLERGDAQAGEMGILPQLAALEMLIYPRSGQVIANNLLLRIGTIEILPSVAPLTIFVWGKRRIMPVRISEFSVTEDAHHPNLSPIRAKVTLGLRVLSYSDVSAENPAWNLFLAHQVIKESLAALATTSSLDSVLGGSVKLM
jgi:hypothetical protein